MPVSPEAQAAQVFASYYGVPVTGSAKTLPASGTGHLFTVSGGRVIVCSLNGAVTTAIQAQACTISIGNTPSGGSASTTSIATASASVSSDGVGVPFCTVPFVTGSAQQLAQGTVNGVLSGASLGVSVDDGGICIVPAGTIDWTTSATNTGAVQWTVCYVPLDVGAAVTAL